MEEEITLDNIIWRVQQEQELESHEAARVVRREFDEGEEEDGWNLLYLSWC